MHARAYNLVFGSLEDTEGTDIAWMPAHAKADDVVALLLGNGVPLSEIDRRANGEADKLAKEVAGSVGASAASIRPVIA